MRRITTLFTILLFIGSTVNLFGQMKSPTVMVVPSDVWCYDNGYSETFDNQGRNVCIPDYKRAFQENSDLLNVTTKIGELLTEYGLNVTDMYASIRNLQSSEAQGSLTDSTFYKTPLERLLAYAKADIMVEVDWTINSAGRLKSVSCNIRGVDTYSNKQFAESHGTSAESFSAHMSDLLNEAVHANMYGFISQLQNHFEDMAVNGREIVFNIKVSDKPSGFVLSDDYNGYKLSDLIKKWMYDNTVHHRCYLSDEDESHISFEQVRIPLFIEKGRPMDARQFASGLSEYLSSSPYNIPSRTVTNGLGRIELILGEK